MREPDNAVIRWFNGHALVTALLCMTAVASLAVALNQAQTDARARDLAVESAAREKAVIHAFNDALFKVCLSRQEASEALRRNQLRIADLLPDSWPQHAEAVDIANDIEAIECDPTPVTPPTTPGDN